MPNCLVTGATGYVGSRLVPRLLESGHRVRALARDPDKLAHVPWRGAVDVVTGDLDDEDSLVAAATLVADITTSSIATAGTTRFDAGTIRRRFQPVRAG